ncbi:hypothetical protein LMH87_011351 [Akanthomyces muscarius]|uniref:Uncharacterized protein n=1 Tax=Akanthomyces muscarius TaxID=2231603 RepID=A0A9W8Q9S3_AKAMU|nr:hypothetical protein LMH87_011351 [Akanthomyces muscarius]KAJ4150609.1 hypothetical protein LMH87_011351 [Akanthomyces muscarius]
MHNLTGQFSRGGVTRCAAEKKRPSILHRAVHFLGLHPLTCQVARRGTSVMGSAKASLLRIEPHLTDFAAKKTNAEAFNRVTRHC